MGRQTEYYNNVGYSHLLRGDLTKARFNLLKAYELDPTNAAVNNNLEMLRSSSAQSTKS
ncbi:tetratricopeptide repeat protein [Microvirga aerilata]|uniref:tetratricopeptide repeat protein n=1 Tax=Microvirga aerilata TaxID=670292 RepID=UPI00363A0365